jgi:hypothetical protein
LDVLIFNPSAYRPFLTLGVGIWRLNALSVISSVLLSKHQFMPLMS